MGREHNNKFQFFTAIGTYIHHMLHGQIKNEISPEDNLNGVIQLVDTPINKTDATAATSPEFSSVLQTVESHYGTLENLAQKSHSLTTAHIHKYIASGKHQNVSIEGTTFNGNAQDPAQVDSFISTASKKVKENMGGIVQHLDVAFEGKTVDFDQEWHLGGGQSTDINPTTNSTYYAFPVMPNGGTGGDTNNQQPPPTYYSFPTLPDETGTNVNDPTYYAFPNLPAGGEGGAGHGQIPPPTYYAFPGIPGSDDDHPVTSPTYYAFPISPLGGIGGGESNSHATSPTYYAFPAIPHDNHIQLDEHTHIALNVDDYLNNKAISQHTITQKDLTPQSGGISNQMDSTDFSSLPSAPPAIPPEHHNGSLL